ncbi:MAG: RNA ligase family protein [Ignavibacteriales bacterium]
MLINPIVPFEPVTTDQIPQDKKWIAQVKWDGVRVLTYYDGQAVRLFNRHLHERTNHYPEVAGIKEYCKAASIILDGEIIALKQGKPSFYEVMRRDGISHFTNLGYLVKTIPITYMVFDVLFINDRWVNTQSLSDRQEILKEYISPNQSVHLVESFADPSGLYEAVKQQQMEGVVIKDVGSTYQFGGKDKRWCKKKFYRDLIAVVGGITLRNSVVNALLLGLFGNDGRLWYIGHAGTGRLTGQDWSLITKITEPLIQTETPFANRPSRLKGARWLKPQLTVKVQFAEWIEGHTLRQPSIQALVDVPAYECIIE